MCKEEKKEEPTNKLTIVGGQPERKDLPAFNTNIEKVLLKAIENENFRNALFKDRKSVLEDPELSLTPQDKMILSSIPLDKLEDMIEKFKLQINSKEKILKGAVITTTVLTSSYLNLYSYRTNNPLTRGIRPLIDPAQDVSTASNPLVIIYYHSDNTENPSNG